MTKGLIDDEQGGFRAGRWCVDLHPQAESSREKMYVGFMVLEKAYDRINWEPL